MVMLVSIAANYVAGLLIQNAQKKVHQSLSKLCATMGIVVNITLLVSFKYANFIADNINLILNNFNFQLLDLEPVHLPLGISFFTFQAISYIVDIYKKEVPAQKNIFDLALYLALFPQLIAGPIVRYHDVALQITRRTHSIELFASGAKRFIHGLAKKMLIANPLGEVTDAIFTFSGNDLTLPLAWIGITAYTLQIYFDFSGYSDMAIGLGRMFGFKFQENFNYPYIAKSLREFWQRWHISLSTWFRDYVYIALGGNRVSTVRVYINLLIVFILTGFWHGASWNFLIWGLFHGIFLASEHAGTSKMLKRIWQPAQHIYLLMVIITGWVFFRADTLAQAVAYIKSMVDISHSHTTSFQYAQVLSHEALYAFFIGIILSTPAFPLIKKAVKGLLEKSSLKTAISIEILGLALIFSLLFCTVLKIASSTYNPFIYFRF